MQIRVGPALTPGSLSKVVDTRGRTHIFRIPPIARGRSNLQAVHDEEGQTSHYIFQKFNQMLHLVDHIGNVIIASY